VKVVEYHTIPLKEKRKIRARGRVSEFRLAVFSVADALEKIVCNVDYKLRLRNPLVEEKSLS
jgi:hypothetical protein